MDLLLRNIKNILYLLLHILLLCVSCIIFPILFAFGILYTTIKHIVLFDYSLSKQVTPIVKSTYLVIDCLANSGAGEMINDAYNVTGNIKYGKWHQTISAITGLRYLLQNNDNSLRRTLDKVLGKDHCIDAINKEDLFFYSKDVC